MSDRDRQPQDKKGKEEAPQGVMVIRRKSYDLELKPVPIWLISFTDVIALMLTFFVLLYAMSDPDPGKWDDKIGVKINAYADFSGAKNSAGNDEGVNLDRVDFSDGDNLDYLQSVFEAAVEKHNWREKIKIKRSSTHLILSWNMDENRLNDDESLKFFNEVTPLLQSLDNRIALVGLSSEKRVFKKLQSFGAALKDFGYSRSFVLRTQSQLPLGNTPIVIYVYPDDGQRING